MELRTERLILRLLNPDVVQQIQRDLTQAEQMTFLGLKSIQELESELAKFNAKGDDNTLTYRWFLIVLPESDEVIGACGYHAWYRNHDRAEIGYNLNDDIYKNKGYMKEVMKTVLDFGFNEMGLHRIEAFVGPFNEPSLRLMDHFRFSREGHLREHYLRDGVYEDSLVFGLIRP